MPYLPVLHILHKDEYECYPAKQQSENLGEELLVKNLMAKVCLRKKTRKFSHEIIIESPR